MIKKFFYISLFFFTAICYAQQKKWTLEECIVYAKEHNVEIQKQKLTSKEIKQDLVIAKGNYLPDVNFSGSHGYSLGNSFNVSTGVGQQESRFNNFSLSSSVTIFNGFANRYELQLAKINSEKGKVDLDKITFDLSLNITNKYLQVLFNKEVLAVSKEQKTISKKEVNRLAKLFELALKSKNEMLEMRATFSLDKKEEIIARNNLTNSVIELKELLDIVDLAHFEIADINIETAPIESDSTQLAMILKQASTHNPYLKSKQFDIIVNQKRVQIAKSGFYPRIDFNYSYGSNYYHVQGSDDLVFNQQTNQFEDNGLWIQLDNNKTHYLNFSLHIPIFNKFLNKSNLHKATLKLETAELDYKNQQKELNNKIKKAFNNVVSAKATLEASNAALVAQKEAFSIVQRKYNRGLTSSYEFLESKSKYIKTQSEKINAKYDYLFKIKILEYYNGK